MVTLENSMYLVLHKELVVTSPLHLQCLVSSTRRYVDILQALLLQTAQVILTF